MPGSKKLGRDLLMSSNPIIDNVISPDKEDIAIKVTNITKRYQIYDAPRDRLKQFVMPRLRQISGRASKEYFREFPALTDISFEVRKGENVGVIGRNGAGKSTLLQIICGTLTPTSGTIEINGRVAALLELGSGFNAEFSGRENIYTNAGVLGLSKEEIDARFEDSVAFADIGDFLDQPVKTYSSGMYVRLAFAVVVHVDADILIVDEALSVGDMYFQTKCMVKMKKMMELGVTVLFVSHDVGAVKAICSRAVYLDHGKVVTVGPTDQVVETYYGAGVKSEQGLDALSSAPASTIGKKWTDIERADQQEFAARAAYHRVQNGMAELLNVQLLDKTGRKIEVVDFGQTVILRMLFKSNVDLVSVGLAYHIRDRNGVDVIYSDTGIERCHVMNLSEGEVVSMDWEFTVHLRHGEYSIAAMLSVPLDLSIGKAEVLDFAPMAVNFQAICGGSLPIYGAAYWANKVSHKRLNNIVLEDE